MKLLDLNYKNPAFIVFIVFSALSILFFVVSYVCFVPAEDAVILYEYSKNLSRFGLIAYGGSIHPIEGATDFLWMVIIAFINWLGFDEFGGALFLNCVALLFILGRFKKALPRFVFGVAIFSTPYIYASLAGFSAVFFSAFYVLALILFFNKSKWFYLSVLVLCLIRPDGVFWGAGLVAYRLYESLLSKKLKSELLFCFVFLILPGIIYFIWRAWYFSELFPLPFLVKSSSARDFLIFYKDSIYSVGVIALPVFLTYLLCSRTKKDFFLFLIVFSFPVLFYALVKLEQNVGNRFMAPLFFAAAYIFYSRCGVKALTLFSMLAVLLQLPMLGLSSSSLFNSSRETVYYLAQDLSSISGRMLVTEAGRLTYYSGWFSEDSWGLNTPRYAKQLISQEDIEQGNYDLVVAHCDIDLLRMDDIKYDSARTWNNQCRAIASYLKNENVSIFLVPYYMGGLPYNFSAESSSLCARHDIYAVSRNYEYFSELVAIIKDHRGIPYSDSLSVFEDRVCH